MDLGLKDKRVLVTGASRGMGRDIALAFAAEGCRVTIVARREKDLKAVLEEMGGQGLGHEHYTVDLMAEGAAVKAVQALVKRGGAFDIVIHNLGGTLNIKDHLAPMQQWYEVWKLNIGIAIEINSILVPLMKTKGWGRIIHMSSTAAEHFRGAAAYGVAKAYLNAYTQSLGRRLAKDGIVMSAVMYSVMKTAGGYWDEDSETNRQFREQFLQRKENLLKEHQPIGRLGEVEDIVPFVLFMASEKARFAAASIIPVTGGGS
jgi:3-oxoacyl-[acyl-carrier protein] reductase